MINLITVVILLYSFSNISKVQQFSNNLLWLRVWSHSFYTDLWNQVKLMWKHLKILLKQPEFSENTQRIC